MEKKFETGTIYKTQGIEASKIPFDEVAGFIKRHISGDWGDMPEMDKSLNDLAISDEGNHEVQDRVMSCYTTKTDIKIWIITEWNREYTTILLPTEY